MFQIKIVGTFQFIWTVQENYRNICIAVNIKISVFLPSLLFQIIKCLTYECVLLTANSVQGVAKLIDDVDQHH